MSSIHMFNNHFLKACLAAVFAIGLAACSSSSDNDTADVTEPVQEPMQEPEPAPPSDLETTRVAAAAAAAAAMTASDNADAAADGAEAATANSATLQTGEMAEMYAMGARESAKEAMAEYMKAKAASEAAAAATMASAAGVELAKAKAAQAAAEAAAKTAGEKAMKATDAAKMELKIDGTMKTVGDTTVDAAAPKSEVTSGSGDDEQKTITGLVSTPMTTGPTTNGRAAVDAVITTDPPTKYVSPMVNAAERSGDNALKIGKIVDSADDMARLQIITAYASTKSVRVYDAAASTGHMGSKEGKVEVVTADGSAITVATGLGADTNTELTLRPVGMFYEVDGGNNEGQIDALSLDTTTDPDNPAQQGDTVAGDTKAKQVYSFVNTADTTNNQPTVYVVLNKTTSETEGGETDTVYEYVIVDIHESVNRDGIGLTGTGEGASAGAGDEDVFVTAALPAAKSYSHVHFGVWADLGAAAKNGDQKIADLGIGFVQSIGDGPTGADMPNAGMATYMGNWAGTVQEAHPDGDGTINLKHGNAMLKADLDKNEITATLTDLAELSGTITGNTFSGTKASDVEGMHGLDPDGTFTGSFSGGFYGEKAAESAGIFSFDGKTAGAFVGAFGGAKDE